MTLPKICLCCHRPMGGPGRWDLRRSQVYPSMCVECDNIASDAVPAGLATGHGDASVAPGDETTPSPGDKKFSGHGSPPGWTNCECGE